MPTGIDPDLIFSMCGDLFAVLDIFGLDPHFRLIPTTRVNDERGELLYIRAKLHIFLETCSYLICFGSFRQLHGCLQIFHDIVIPLYDFPNVAFRVGICFAILA